MRLRATTTLRNEAMLSARKRLGISQSKAAERCRVGRWVYMRLEKLDWPFKIDYDVVLRIAAGLGIAPDDVMVEQLRGIEFPNKFIKTVQVEPSLLLECRARQSRYILPAPSACLEQYETVEEIKKIMSTLSYREQEVIKLRYGLADGHGYTLEEVGRIFRVTRDRIRSIEARAIRKIQKRAGEIDN